MPTFDDRTQMWLDRWNEGRIGFHQSRVNEKLEQYISHLRKKQNSHCLVPLCGKSLDVKWIADQGHLVTGIEISDRAVREFIEENNISIRSEKQTDQVTIFQSKQLNLVQGNFFHVRPSDIPAVTWIYDRASLISFPQKDQKRYVEQCERFLSKKGQILLISFEYNPSELTGPPFAVSESSIHELYEPTFQIQKLERENRLALEQKWRDRGLTSLYRGVYLLTKK